MSSMFRPAAAITAAMLLAGCASLPRERGYAQTQALIQARRDVVPPTSLEAFAERPPVPTTPLDAEQAVALAFFHNPRIREEYARLGLGRAELEDARRIANPTFGYARLSPRDGDGHQITRSLSIGLTDLLLLPARKRFAQGELERLQQTVAAALLELATDVEIAWYDAVGAEQVAGMRELVAQAAGRSADLAQRFFDAGNITRLALEQELAAATLARIEAVRARAEALRARSTLAGLVGLSSSDAWTTQTQLPAPPLTRIAADALVPLALENRLDLSAARIRVTLREDALGITRRWRWLGSIQVGYERESEIDGEVLRGPSLSLELPIFNQGQGAVMRAQAELMQARAELDALVLNVHNSARLSVEQLAVARDIAERYRTELVPRREAIVARTQEQVNYMLVGVFELLLAKQQEYDAYQEYLEAVRDFWTARARLRGAVGGRLPDDGATLAPTIGVDAIVPSTPPASMAPGADGTGTDDPHAGHTMPMPASTDDASRERTRSTPTPTDNPHVGHTMPMPTSTDDSKAGHEVLPAAPAKDPHAGHAMPSVTPAPVPDPHAGHGMPTADPKATPPPVDVDPEDDATHDHGDTP